MAVSIGCSSGSGSNTPATDSTSRQRWPRPPADRKYLLERVDERRSCSCMPTASRSCRSSEKTLIWHLYQAALAGRDIFYDQRYAHNLEMRDVLEEIITHPDSVDPQTLAEIQRYTKLFWINTGPYNNLTARKFVLKCTPEAFAAAAARRAERRRAVPAAGRRDARRAARRGCSRCSSTLNVDPIVTNKTPAPGKDILAASANNLYVGVTMKDLEGFDEQYPLNSRLVKQQRQARRGGLPRRRQVRRADPRDRRAPRGGDSVRHRADGEGARGAREVLPDRRDGGSRGLRHRLGRGQGVAGRHDQRVHRGLHGRRAG